MLVFAESTKFKIYAFYFWQFPVTIQGDGFPYQQQIY